MLQRLFAALVHEEGRWKARQGDFLLDSVFQPVFSFPHRRAVGYEALLRVTDTHGQPLSPLSYFQQIAGFDHHWESDRLCRLLHVHNFIAQTAGDDGWLFLNIHPAVFIQGAGHLPAVEGSVQVLDALGLPLHRVVLEVTEDVMAQESDFALAVTNARSTGCLLALDDFGAGHSNFDRVWHLHPEIVKLDRSLLRRAVQSPRVARVLGQMVSLLHECGSLVLLEGVETRDEAMLALDADVDMVQGFAFGRPKPGTLGPRGASAEIDEVWALLDERHAKVRREHADHVAPFRHAIKQALPGLRQGQPMAQACAELLALPGTQICFLLDDQGRNVSPPVAPPNAPHVVPEARFAPLLRSDNEARWARRPYFRRAVADLGLVQMTRPYLSLYGSRMCVTISVAFWTEGRLLVLCADIDWSGIDL
jgi:EAL domain-containing protein (putative c-di-GMP-specific phosphodiesterase class I)